MGILVLFQISLGRLSLFHVEYYIGCGFVINSFYYVEICSLWASLVAQLVKSLTAMQETPVRLLSQEDTLEKG